MKTELTLAYLGGVQFLDTCKGPEGGGFPAPSSFCLDALDEKKEDPASKPINMSKRKRCQQIRKPSTKPHTGRRRSSWQKARQRASKLVMLIDTSKPHPRETKNSKKPLFCVDLDSVLSTNRKRLAKPKNLKEPNTLASMNIPASPEPSEHESSDSEMDVKNTPPPKHTIKTSGGSMAITQHGIKKTEKKVKPKKLSCL